MTKCFVDTNVLAYAKDKRSPSKQTRAQAWLRSLTAADALVLSAQSLREYYAVSLRLDRSAQATRDTRFEIARYGMFVPAELREDRLGEAWALEDRYRLGFYDSLLLAAALAAGCGFFLSEDLSDGQRIDTLTVIDPFRRLPQDVLGA